MMLQMKPLGIHIHLQRLSIVENFHFKENKGSKIAKADWGRALAVSHFPVCYPTGGFGLMFPAMRNPASSITLSLYVHWLQSMSRSFDAAFSRHWLYSGHQQLR